MSLPCCCNLSRQGICHSNWHKFWDDEFGSFVFLALKKGVRGKERESEQILICLRFIIYGFGLYASHNRMLWGFFPKYFPCLACLGWLHPNDQILSEVRTASRLLCKLKYHLFISSQNVGEKWITTYCTYLLTVLDIELCSGHLKNLTRWRITRFCIV